MNDTVGALSRVSLLSVLDSRDLKRLARDFSEKTFPAGSTVVEHGQEHGIGFFVIDAGEATVSIDGREVASLGAGDHFGEIALLNDRVRTATVTATTDLRCLVMTLWDFRSFVRSNPDVARKLVQNLAQLLGETTTVSGPSGSMNEGATAETRPGE